MPEQRGIDELSRAIGSLESQVKGLREDIQQQETYTHKSIHAIRNDLTVQQAAIATLVKDMADIKPIVEDYRNARLKASGVVLMLSLVWGVIAMWFNEIRIALKKALT